MDKITLYYHPKTRASRPRWLLEELGVPYDLHKINLRQGEHKHPDYLKVHPLGLIPALEINGKKMIESGAMCLYLADRFISQKLAPPLESAERQDYVQWFFFFQNHLEPPLATYFENAIFLPEEKRRPELLQGALEKFSSSAKIVEAHLQHLSYMLPHFSALDCFAGSMIIWAQGMRLLGDFPKLEAYANRLKERPAWKKATLD